MSRRISDPAELNVDPAVRDIATVTVLKPVDGTRKRKTRSDKGKRRIKAAPTHQIKVDPRVMRAAKAARLPGQRLVIVDHETVRLVNS